MTRFLSRRTLLNGTVAALAASALPTRVLAQAALKPMTVALTSKTASDWAVYAAESLGFFTQNGIKPDFIITGSSSACAQQLTAGSVDVGEVSTTQLIEAVLGGAPITGIINRTNNAPYVILGKKGYKSIADLKGKTIIVGGPNDITLVFMNTVLAAYKLKQEDVTYTFAGGTAERFAALLSGTVDAAILLPPFSFKAIDAGYPVLDYVQKYFKVFPFDTFSARTDTVKKNPEILLAYTKSVLQGVRWLYDPANKTKAIEILAQATNVAEADAAKTYEFFVVQAKFYNATGVMSKNDLAPVIAALLQTNQIKPPAPDAARFYDNTFANKANADVRRK